jgi:hypothetical protein
MEAMKSHSHENYLRIKPRIYEITRTISKALMFQAMEDGVMKRDMPSYL